MIITKHKGCEVCETPVTEVKEFKENLDMFDPESNPLKGDLLDELKKWRDRKVYCPEHQLTEQS